MKKLSIILLIFILLTPVTFANTITQNPVQAIQSAIVKFNKLTMATYSPQTASLLVDKEIAPLFDFDYIAKEVLLAINTHFGADEAAFFSNKLKNNITTTLLTKLGQTHSTTLRFISARPVINNNIIVRLQVGGYYSFGFYIDLLFHQSQNGKWQIFDIVLNNDSLINYYQKMVLIQVKRHGIYGMLDRI